MTTTPEPLTWTPDDGTEALLAIRDRVKAAQDADVQPMTAWIDGAVITDSPYIDEDDLMLVVSGCYVTVYDNPRPHLTRVEWTPPADPEPVALNEKPDPVARVGLFRHPWTKGSDMCTECGDTYHEHLWLDAGDHGHTICPKNLPTPTPPTELDPEPSWADADVVIAAGDYPDGAFNLRLRRGSEWWTPFWTGPRDTQQVAEAYRLDGTTPVALIHTVDGKPRVCAEAILALGVDDNGTLWDWLAGLGRPRGGRFYTAPVGTPMPTDPLNPGATWSEVGHTLVGGDQ